jgi:hypothetical protein
MNGTWSKLPLSGIHSKRPRRFSSQACCVDLKISKGAVSACYGNFYIVNPGGILGSCS